MRLGWLVCSFPLMATCGHPKAQPPPDDMITFRGQSFVGDDFVCAPGTTTLRDSASIFRARVSVRDFTIDRRVVTCAEYERCVDAGVCSKAPAVMKCLSGLAAVRRDGAAAYCSWRNAKLPSWYEWQLAVRGPDACEYPTCHEHRPEYDSAGSDEAGRPLVSPGGVEYRWDAHSWLANEATRDDDCWRSYPAEHPDWVSVGPVSGFTAGALHASVDNPNAGRASFRCVRD